MADGMVSIEVAAKLGEAIRNFEVLAAGVGKVVDKLDQANKKGKEGDDVGKQGATNFEQMAGSAGRALTAIIGIGSATAAMVKGLQLANQELEAITKRQANAAQHQIGLTGATRAMIRNLGSGADLTAAQAVAGVQGIALDTKASQEAVMQAASGVLSARGRFSASDALGQLKLTAALDPSFSGADLQTLAGAGLDVRKAFGGTGEQAIGMILAGQQVARVEDTATFAKNAIPTALALSQQMYGNLSPDKAFGLYGAFTQAAGDKTGEQSKTGLLTFASQLMKLPGMDGMDVEQRIAAVGSDPKYAKQKAQLFAALGSQYGLDPSLTKRLQKGERVEGLHGEAAMLPAMYGMLTPGSNVFQEYQAARAGMPTAQGAADFYTKNVAAAQSVDLFVPARIAESARARVEQFRSDPNRGAAGAVTQAFETVIPESGVEAKIVQDARAKINEIMLANADRVQALRRAETVFGDYAEQAATYTTMEYQEHDVPTAKINRDYSRRGVAEFKALADEMRAMREALERNTTATQGNTTATGGSGGAASKVAPRLGEPGAHGQAAGAR